MARQKLNLDLAWLIGILEGEGSFMLTNHRTGKARKNGSKGRFLVPIIHYSSIDPDVTERVAKLFSTNPHGPYPNGRGHCLKYAARLENRRAAALMRKIQPYMGARRAAQIDGVLCNYAH